MTTANEPADDNALADEIFSSDRADRGGKEPAIDTAESGQSRDERGRFASRQGDEHEAAPQAAKDSADAAPKEPSVAESSPDHDANANRHVPLSEMLNVRRRAQEAERNFTELQSRFDELSTLVHDLRRSQQSPELNQQDVQPPDPVMDPEGYMNHRLSDIQMRQRSQILDLYEDRVREKHGDEKVDAALKLARQTGAVQNIMMARDPWSALMKWSSAYHVGQTVGDDIEAYNKRIADEAVAKALASLKAGNPTPASSTFPSSLAASTATGNQGAVLTEQAIADDVFGSSRRRGG